MTGWKKIQKRGFRRHSLKKIRLRRGIDLFNYIIVHNPFLYEYTLNILYQKGLFLTIYWAEGRKLSAGGKEILEKRLAFR